MHIIRYQMIAGYCARMLNSNCKCTDALIIVWMRYYPTALSVPLQGPVSMGFKYQGLWAF